MTTLSFDVLARDRASSTMNRVGSSVDNLHGRLSRVSRSALRAAAGFTSVTLAAGAFLKVGADYAGSLNKIQALTDTNDTAMRQVAKTLESQSSQYAKMGQTTGDAAAGVVELAKAGLSLDSSLKSVNATMVLAKAGELEVADASTLVANTLNTFGLKANRAADIANYLANAANISSADVSDLAESFKYVAPVAASTGVSLKQTNAILAELSNSGISASQAGTGFRKFLLSLQAPSGAAARDLKELNVEIFDATGKMKPLGTVIDLLNSKLSQLTDERRQQILKNVFGLAGLSTAQVILKNGAKGLAEYTRGVGKAGAAQKLAEANSKGFAGTLTALRSEIVSDAQALYRKLSPSLDDAAKKIQTFIQQMKSGKGAGGDFVDILKTIWKAAEGTVKFLDGLPGPVKSFGVEAGIAALILPRLTAGITAGTTAVRNQITYLRVLKLEMTDATRRTQLAGAAMGKLATAATTAAGIGGMLALTESAKSSNNAIKVLGSTAGGALLGFSVGGPIGAAVGGAGGLAGAMASLKTETQKANEAIAIAKRKAQDYKNTLDPLTGAITAVTRAAVLQRLEDAGALETGTRLGLTQRQLVNAALGREAATRKLNRALFDQGVVFDDSGKAVLQYDDANRLMQADLITLSQIVADSTRTTEENADKVREQALATRSLKELFKDFPKDIRTQMRLLGVPDSKQKIRELGRAIKLTPEQVTTILKVTGVDDSVKDVDKFVEKVVNQTPKKARDGGKKTGEAVTKGTVSALSATAVEHKLNLVLTGAINPAKKQGREGGTATGNNIGAGLYGGLDAWAAPIRNRMVQLIRDGLAAANAEAAVHSPSRKTMYIGQMLGRGLAVGMDATVGRVAAAGKRLVVSALAGGRKAAAGAGGGGGGAGYLTAQGLAAQIGNEPIGTLSTVNTLWAQAAKDTSAVTAAERVLKQERKGGKKNAADIRKAEKALTKARDAQTASTDRAKSAMEALIEVAKGFRNAVLDLGAAFGGTATSTTAEGFLAKLLSAGSSGNAFQVAIATLRGRGLNEGIIRQLLTQSATPEGLALAQSLAAAPAELIAQINAAQTNLENVATTVGGLAGNVGTGVVTGRSVTFAFNGPITTVDPKAAAAEINQRQREMSSLVRAS